MSNYPRQRVVVVKPQPAHQEFYVVTENLKIPEPRMTSRAIYQITVKGKLSEHWADWFNGTLINFDVNFAGYPHTILTCQVRDQAELFGILSRLNSLNLPLLQVIYINNERENNVAVDKTQDR